MNHVYGMQKLSTDYQKQWTVSVIRGRLAIFLWIPEPKIQGAHARTQCGRRGPTVSDVTASPATPTIYVVDEKF